MSTVAGGGRSGPQGGAGAEPLLSVRNLRSEIDTENGTVTAVDGVSFDLFGNEVLAVVGESGCGKTMLALSILGLLPGAQVASPAVRCCSGARISRRPRRRACGRSGVPRSP